MQPPAGLEDEEKTLTRPYTGLYEDKEKDNIPVLLRSRQINIAVRDLLRTAEGEKLSTGATDAMLGIAQEGWDKGSPFATHVLDTSMMSTILAAAETHDHGRMARCIHQIGLVENTSTKVIGTLYDNGSQHWAAVQMSPSGDVQVYNSLQGLGNEAFKKNALKLMDGFAMVVSHWAPSTKTYIYHEESPQQRNTTDCGLFTVAAIHALKEEDFIDADACVPPHLTRARVTAVLEARIRAERTPSHHAPLPPPSPDSDMEEGEYQPLEQGRYDATEATNPANASTTTAVSTLYDLKISDLDMRNTAGLVQQPRGKLVRTVPVTLSLSQGQRHHNSKLHSAPARELPETVISVLRKYNAQMYETSISMAVIFEPEIAFKKVRGKVTQLLK